MAVGEIASGVMGAAVKSLPVVGTAYEVGSDYLGGQNEQADIEKYFGKQNIRRAMRQNPALAKKLKDCDERWEGTLLASIASIGGGAAGGALLGFFIPVVGPVIGMVAGGFGGNYLYEKALVTQAQDPVVINMQIGKMQQAGEKVPVEVVGAALAANLSGKQGKQVDRLLKNITGTKSFAEALSDPNNLPKIAALMNNPVVDDALRAATGMPRDEQNPLKTVAEQYAELINSGKMDARNMLNRGEGVYALAASMQQGRQYSVDVPETPNMARGVGRAV